MREPRQAEMTRRSGPRAHAPDSALPCRLTLCCTATRRPMYVTTSKAKLDESRVERNTISKSYLSSIGTTGFSLFSSVQAVYCSVRNRVWVFTFSSSCAACIMAMFVGSRICMHECAWVLRAVLSRPWKEMHLRLWKIWQGFMMLVKYECLKVGQTLCYFGGTLWEAAINALAKPHALTV